MGLGFSCCGARAPEEPALFAYWQVEDRLRAKFAVGENPLLGQDVARVLADKEGDKRRAGSRAKCAYDEQV